MGENNNEDFGVTLGTKINDDTVLLTSTDMTKEWLESAMQKYDSGNKQYSSYLNDISSNSAILSDDDIDKLSINPQSDLSKIQKINFTARYYINKEDLIGKVYETIESNINTDYQLVFKDFDGNKTKTKRIEKAKEVIENFNRQINIKQLIRKSIPLTYAEGNYPMYLKKKGDSYIVDHYPLGVVEISDYEYNGEPYLLINIKELEDRLKKVNHKNRDGSSLFFDNISDEIKNNYPKEVYDAHIKKNKYAKLDIKYSGILRINNMNRKYGVTPIFRTFRPAMMLDVFEKSDKVNAQSKGKKIIFQKLRKEVLGQDFNKKGFEEMAYSHDRFLQSWKNKIVIYTGAGWVEDIKYIEPTTENTNIDNVNYYRNKIMTDLGIGFLNSENKSAFASAQISIKELMKTINKISEQLEDVIRKWYMVVLSDNGIQPEYCPDIKIVDSELLETELKIKLADVLFNKFGMSFRTTYEMLGLDYENEKILRRIENENAVDETIFYPRMTAYTFSAKGKEDYENEGGRPRGDKDPDKQQEDIDRRKAKEGI